VEAKAENGASPAPAAPLTFWDKWKARTESTFVMIALFALLVYLGHSALVGLIFVLQIWIFVELRDLRDKTIFQKLKEKRKKKFAPFILDWIFFAASTHYIYGRLLIARFGALFFQGHHVFRVLAEHHSFVSFGLYVLGFVMFVASLEAGMYKVQFIQLAWTFVILQITVLQSSFYLNTLFEGLIWFFLPVSLVVANDIWAFIFGFFFGKTPLIQLSPKKTVEGFVGGFAATVFFALLFSSWLSRYTWMTCPKGDLFTWAVTCEPDAVFQWTTYQLPALVHSVLSAIGLGWFTHIHYMPLHVHAVVIAVFASLIAPFGGFFASGLKRAIKIKDFAESIPGHGGIADRMDCQLLMGVFMYVYYTNFVRVGRDVSGLLNAILLLAPTDQQKIFDALRKQLQK